MALNISSFKIDLEVETEGYWHELDDSRICIARLGNPRYKRLVRERLAPHLRKRMSEEQQDHTLGVILGETILLGWENVEEDGKELPFNKETAIRLMTSPEYKDFRDVIVYLAEREEFYRRDYIEACKKKSLSG